MRYPKFLPKHGTIAFVAPSFGCNIEPYRTAFEHALSRFKRMGYRLKLGPNCFAGEGVGISSTPAKCGEELTNFYLSEENDCLISCGGGELMCEILDEVDWDAIGRAPAKWFMGYSDNTNVTYLLATCCDTASVYGPCAASFGMQPLHRSLKDAFSLLTGRTDGTVRGYPSWEAEPLKDEDNPLAPYHLTKRKILTFCDGKTDRLLRGEKIPLTVFQGRLLGGCMDCLINLLGTGYDRTEEFIDRYEKDGIIWFLEACDLNVFGIRRAMWEMEHAGWFRHVKGFLIGRPLAGYEDMMNLDRFEAVLSVAGKLGVPVVMDADLGHRPPMLPLVTGSYASVRVEGNDLSVSMKLRE